MENASKALIMAGGVLVGILILSLAIYLFVTFSAQTVEINKEVEQQQLNQFNSKYTSYMDKEGMTIYDIITVVHMAQENNEINKDNASVYITVNLNNKQLEKSSEEKLKEMIINDTNSLSTKLELPKYLCKSVKINSNTKRVEMISFQKKE